jgi:hypothetical protein
MKKVIVFQAKDGSTHGTPKACKAHDAKLLLAPAIAGFVKTLDTEVYGGAFLAQLEAVIGANADALRTALTEPLITRRPRKAKAAKAAPAPVAAA